MFDLESGKNLASVFVFIAFAVSLIFWSIAWPISFALGRGVIRQRRAGKVGAMTKLAGVLMLNVAAIWLVWLAGLAWRDLTNRASPITSAALSFASLGTAFWLVRFSTLVVSMHMACRDAKTGTLGERGTWPTRIAVGASACGLWLLVLQLLTRQ